MINLGSPNVSTSTEPIARDSPTRVANVQVPWVRLQLLVTSIVVFAWLLFATSYRNFFLDEWAFIEQRRPWDVNLFLLPHGDHWSTLPILLWKTLFVTVGIRRHVPYEAALLLVHVAVVFLLFTLIRRRSGDLLAFGAALVMLVLGSGSDEIVWAFQVAWAGSVAFGLVAMLLLDGDPPFRSRLIPVTAAILCSLMCSSVGLAFLAAIGAELLADGRRRRFLLALVLPAAAFGVWFLIYDTGRPGFLGTSGDFLQGATQWGYIGDFVRFAVTGIAASVRGVTGATGVLGAVLALLVTFLIANDIRRRAEPWQFGMLAGLLFFFMLIAAGRVQFGISFATQTRYVYVGVVFLLPLVAHALREVPWSGLWRPALLVAFAVFVFGNLMQLQAAAVGLKEYMWAVNAELQTVEVFRGAPDMALDRYIDNSVISEMRVNVYLAAIDELGSPVPPATVTTLRQAPSFAVDRVMLNLFGDALTLKADSSRPVQGMSCTDIDTAAGAERDIRVPGGGSLMLQSSNGGDAQLFLGFLAPPVSALHSVQLAPGTPGWIHVPDTGKSMMWQLRIKTGAVGMLRVCGPN